MFWPAMTDSVVGRDVEAFSRGSAAISAVGAGPGVAISLLGARAVFGVGCTTIVPVAELPACGVWLAVTASCQNKETIKWLTRDSLNTRSALGSSRTVKVLVLTSVSLNTIPTTGRSCGRLMEFCVFFRYAK